MAVQALAAAEAVKSGAEFAKSEQGQKAIKAGSTILKIGGIALGTYLVYQAALKIRRNNFLNREGHTAEVQAAYIAYRAMIGNPFKLGPFGLFGIPINLPNGTDEEALNKLALENIKLSSISRAYRIIFNRNLLQDINSELTSGELKSFFDRLNANDADCSKGINQVQKFLIGETVYSASKQPITLRVFKNGQVTNETGGTFEFGEKIGKIEQVINDQTLNRVFYVIDKPFSTVEVYVEHCLITNTAI